MGNKCISAQRETSCYLDINTDDKIICEGLNSTSTGCASTDCPSTKSDSENPIIIIDTNLILDSKSFNSWESFDYKNGNAFEACDQLCRLFSNLKKGETIEYIIDEFNYTAKKLKHGPNIGNVKETNNTTKQIQLFYLRQHHVQMTDFSFNQSSTDLFSINSNNNNNHKHNSDNNNNTESIVKNNENSGDKNKNNDNNYYYMIKNKNIKEKHSKATTAVAFGTTDDFTSNLGLNLDLDLNLVVSSDEDIEKENNTDENEDENKNNITDSQNDYLMESKQSQSPQLSSQQTTTITNTSVNSDNGNCFNVDALAETYSKQNRLINQNQNSNVNVALFLRKSKNM